jgi:hypothetical protein
MAANDSHSLRMVIQQIGLKPAYRVAVYGDLEKPRHADFNTGQILLETLQTALPDLDTSSLSLNPLQKGQGSVVFAGEIMLNERQLGLLGLT